MGGLHPFLTFPAPILHGLHISDHPDVSLHSLSNAIFVGVHLGGLLSIVLSHGPKDIGFPLSVLLLLEK
jgi:hypothetical protein